MDNGLISDILKKKNIFAVIGVSENKKKYGRKIYFYLKNAGYKVYPVNPKLEEIEGEKCYPSLDKLPKKPNVVSVVVPPNITEKIVEKCKELGIKKVWMQPGSESKKAINFCRDNKIKVIHSACILIEEEKSN